MLAQLDHHQTQPADSLQSNEAEALGQRATISTPTAANSPDLNGSARLLPSTEAESLVDARLHTAEAIAAHIRLGRVVKRDRNRRAVVIGILPFAPFAVLGAINMSLTEDKWIELCNQPSFVAIAVAACVAFPIWVLKPSKRARQATGDLAKVEDIAAVGSMIETLMYSEETSTALQVKETLIRLLPQLRASDAHLFSNRQMAMLQTMLKLPAFTRGDLLANPFKKIQAHARLQLAILKAFEQIGDERVLSGVTYAVSHGSNREVKRAAAECLPFVQQRVELAKASKTLLRASGSGAADTSILVRPVESGSQAAEEMLRPSAP